ncbi:MAG: xanthine dehydrogenase family protein molybdopterin-binding subunit [Proteobacteria bacterium]|nr:xanthine dehydrogenase family protein molybdopterin-binding subunit [Pseudomonadota bacterium]
MEMNSPIGTTPLDRARDGIVGKPLDRVDGRLKVTGGAKYAYEVAQAPEALYGYVVQATIGKGRITAIDKTAAEAAPGVVLVLTHENAPEQARNRRAHPVLNSPDIAYYGQPVALVVARSFEEARAGAYLVRVSYEEASGSYTLKGGLGQARVPSAGYSSPESAVGDFAGVFPKAPVKLDVTYTTPLETHAMMEPHATLAVWDGDSLTLHTSNQMLDQGRAAVARTLRMPVGKVRLISRFIGGGFGAKLSVQADAILAAIAARHLHHPVKVALTREQIFNVTTHRSDTIQRLRLGTDETGRILAIGHDAYSGNLRTESQFEAAADQTRTLYAGANRLTRNRLVPLDAPIASAMRAPGEAVGLLALECAMDELAYRLDIDPIELRIRNEPAEDPEKHIPFSSRHLVECYRAGAERFGWNKRQPRPGQVRQDQWLIGIGMAAATRGNVLVPSSASVRMGPDGIAIVKMAMTDIGTGSYTILTQIASELLGVPPDRVRMELGDTAYPEAAGSGGSFGAASSGSALYVACERLRAVFADRAGLDTDKAEFRDGMIVLGGKAVVLASLVGASGIEVRGEIRPGDMSRKYSQQSYGAQFAEVAVDGDTGEVRLRRMLGVFTAGRILNEKTARSQAIGGMVFGVGAALEEAVVLDPRFGAYYVNHNLADYLVPVHADLPHVDAVFLPELDDRTNPLKAKGVGELGICGAGAAVANAIYNACGARIRDFPITLDKVMSALPAQA